MNQQPEGTSVPQYYKRGQGKRKKKKGRRPWLWRVGPKQGRVLGGGRGQCSGPTGLEKALGTVGGWGLGSRNRRGPGVPPHPWSQRAWDFIWEPSRLPGLEWVGQMPSSPVLLLHSGVWEGPSHLPLLISSVSLLCPPDQCSWRGGLGGQGTGLGAQQVPCAQVGGANALHSSPAPPAGPLPPASPDLPGVPPMPPRPSWPGGGFGLQGTGLGAQQAPWASVGRAIALCSSPSPPGQLLSPATPGLPGLPPMPPGPTQPGWGFGVGGTGLGAQQAPQPEPSAPLPLFWRVRPTCLS